MREGSEYTYAVGVDKIMAIWNSKDYGVIAGLENFLSVIANEIAQGDPRAADEEESIHDDEKEQSFLFTVGCYLANIRIFEALRSFIEGFDENRDYQSKKCLVRLLLNIDVEAAEGVLDESHAQLVERWLQHGDSFRETPLGFETEPNWAIACQEILDSYYFSKSKAKPFWVQNSELLRALEHLKAQSRNDLNTVAETLTIKNLHDARVALEMIRTKCPEVGVYEIFIEAWHSHPEGCLGV